MIESGLRIAFSLIVVFALMWGIAKVARRPLAGRAGDLLSVVARQQLTRNTSVAVVRLADRALVVGVTDHQVTLLAETTLDALEVPAAPAPTAQRSPVQLVPEISTEKAQVAVRSDDQYPVAASGRLAGSALSPQTWSATIEFLRTRTARR